MKPSQWLPVALVLGLCAVCGSARADIITILYQGTVNQKTDPGGLLAPPFGAPGTHVNGVVQYDTAAPPIAPGPGVADYPFNIFSMTMNGTTFPGHVSLGYDITVSQIPFFNAFHAAAVSTTRDCSRTTPADTSLSI
jgi:hypothetical protein